MSQGLLKKGVSDKRMAKGLGLRPHPTATRDGFPLYAGIPHKISFG